MPCACSKSRPLQSRIRLLDASFLGTVRKLFWARTSIETRPFLVCFLHDRRIRKADKPLDRSNSFCCQPTHLSCCLGRIAEEVAPGKHTHFSEGCRVFDFKYTLSRERSLEVHVAMRVWNMSSWLQHVREQLPWGALERLGHVARWQRRSRNCQQVLRANGT